MSRSARVATLVLNYQEPSDTCRAVESLHASTLGDQRIIVLDNRAHDEVHVDLAASLGPGVECVATGGNLGYAAGNNVGIRLALAGGAEFVWLLNPDTEVEPTTLEQLIATADVMPDAGTLGPRILMADGEHIWFDGGFVNAARLGSPWHRHKGRVAAEVPPGDPYEVDYVTGAALLVRSAVFDRVGLLPESYFLYFEETAFCQLVRREGWRNIVDPRACMVHRQHAVVGMPKPYYLYYFTRSRLQFAREFYQAQPDDVLVHLDQAFLAPFRAKVENAAPNWLPTFDAIVEQAIADARAGVVGRQPGIDDYPSADRYMGVPSDVPVAAPSTRLKPRRKNRHPARRILHAFRHPAASAKRAAARATDTRSDS